MVRIASSWQLSSTIVRNDLTPEEFLEVIRNSEKILRSFLCHFFAVPKKGYFFRRKNIIATAAAESVRIPMFIGVAAGPSAAWI